MNWKKSSLVVWHSSAMNGRQYVLKSDLSVESLWVQSFKMKDWCVFVRCYSSNITNCQLNLHVYFGINLLICFFSLGLKWVASPKDISKQTERTTHLYIAATYQMYKVYIRLTISPRLCEWNGQSAAAKSHQLTTHDSEYHELIFIQRLVYFPGFIENVSQHLFFSFVRLWKKSVQDVVVC